jgi:putative nucleotidyltransferase with HDIG domain
MLFGCCHQQHCSLHYTLTPPTSIFVHVARHCHAMPNSDHAPYRQTIDALLALQTYTDTYTPLHETRVSKLAVLIANELGLDAERTEVLRLAALVHDIGKVDIPLDILNKPGKLTNAEFDLIKTHVQSGYNVLKIIDFPMPVPDIMYAHHEYLDGSGYPRGLKADAIPLESRILTVADIVESMSEDRPYRLSLGIDAAIAEIKRLSGIRLDPLVVDACIRVVTQ